MEEPEKEIKNFVIIAEKVGQKKIVQKNNEKKNLAAENYTTAITFVGMSRGSSMHGIDHQMEFYFTFTTYAN